LQNPATIASSIQGTRLTSGRSRAVAARDARGFRCGKTVAQETVDASASAWLVFDVFEVPQDELTQLVERHVPALDETSSRGARTYQMPEPG
jgi:hypothetical protein